MIRFTAGVLVATLSLANPAFAHATPHGGPAADTTMQESHDHHAAPAPIHIGTLEISDGFTRATLPNAPVAGGFLTIVNTGDEDDRLTDASVDFAAEAQLHEMALENDVMKMRRLADGIPVPAGETVTLAPGGLHLMFMQLQHPLVEGETVMVTLTFEKAGTVSVPLNIASAGAGTGTNAHQH